jgi:hypothetical protein
MLHESPGGPIDASQVGCTAIVPPELIPSTGSVHENVKSVITKRISPYAVVSRNCWAANCQASDRGSFAIARIVCHDDAGSLRVISLPAFHMIVLDTSSDGAIEDDSTRAERSAGCLGMTQLVVAEANVLDTRIEERSVAGIGDRVVLNLRPIGLDTVAM